MLLNVVRFLSLLFLAFALGGSLAHLYELPHKISLSAEDYLVVQQIYRGWALLGIAVAGTLTATLVLAILLRGRGAALGLVLIALLCIIGTQLIFWTITFPVNQATDNWTSLPVDWRALRARWEWSHAAGALLNLVAFASLLLSLLRDAGSPKEHGGR